MEDKPSIDRLDTGRVELKVGDRVRLRPQAGGDILDLVLADKVGVIEAIEQNYEGEFHVAVVIDEDPGRRPVV